MSFWERLSFALHKWFSHESPSQPAQPSTTQPAQLPQPSTTQPAQLPQPSTTQPDASQTQAAERTESLFNQAQLITALWRVVRDGDESQLSEVKQNLDKLTPVLSAYLIAASSAVNAAFVTDQEFRNHFNDAAKDAQEKFEKTQAAIDAGLGIAGAAINLVPAVGQVVSAIIALGIAIKRAILSSLPGPTRDIKANEHIFRDWEGGDCRRGLSLDGTTNPSQRQLINYVDGDLVAATLPFVKRAYQFEFTPTLGQFQKAALQLGLYNEQRLRRLLNLPAVWNVKVSDGVPLTVFDIQFYASGYNVGINGGDYTEPRTWGKLGSLDAKEGRISRVSSELINWATERIDALSRVTVDTQ